MCFPVICLFWISWFEIITTQLFPLPLTVLAWLGSSLSSPSLSLPASLVPLNLLPCLLSFQTSSSSSSPYSSLWTRSGGHLLHFPSPSLSPSAIVACLHTDPAVFRFWHLPLGWVSGQCQHSKCVVANSRSAQTTSTSLYLSDILPLGNRPLDVPLPPLLLSCSLPIHVSRSDSRPERLDGPRTPY